MIAESARQNPSLTPYVDYAVSASFCVLAIVSGVIAANVGPKHGWFALCVAWCVLCCLGAIWFFALGLYAQVEL